jgi:hypothetical protein
MKQQEVLDTLSPVKIEHLRQAIKLIDREEVPSGRGSILYDVVDPQTEKKYPPPYLLEKAYGIAIAEMAFFLNLENVI